MDEERIDVLAQMISDIGDKLDRNDRQLAQTLRENANFQIQVRQGMQQELEELKSRQNGEIFSLILSDIAEIYVDYQTIFKDDSMSDKLRNNLVSLFDDLERILNEYDAEICRSDVGEIRRPRLCKIVGTIPVGEKEKHNTVAASIKPGVMRGNRAIYHEQIYVYVYDPDLCEGNKEIEEIKKEAGRKIRRNTRRNIRRNTRRKSRRIQDLLRQ